MNDKQDRRITLYVSELDRQYWDRAKREASDMGLSLSAYVAIILSNKTIKVVDR